jgi:hypothetical protein
MYYVNTHKERNRVHEENNCINYIKFYEFPDIDFFRLKNPVFIPEKTMGHTDYMGDQQRQ